VKGRALREWLPGELKDNPDLTLAEHRKAFEEEGGMEVSDATMSRAIELGFLVSGRSKKSKATLPGTSSIWLVGSSKPLSASVRSVRA
jgi:hypothetical protein